MIGHRKKIEREFIEELKEDFPKGVLKKRIFYLLSWYEYKSEHYRKLVYWGAFIGMVFPILIAFLNSGLIGVGGIFFTAISTDILSKATVLLASITTAVTGYFTWLKADEHYVRHRMSAEVIKSEAIRYLSRYEYIPKQEKKAFDESFIERVEALSESEISGWKIIKLNQEEKKDVNS